MVRARVEQSVASRLAEALRTVASGQRVREVVVGLVYTAVRLEDGRAGLALTLRGDGEDDCTQRFSGCAPLAGRPALDLLAGLRSADPVEVAVGLACANALANTGELGAEPGDIRETIGLRDDDRVAMIGHFRPLAEPLRQRCRELVIFELIDAPRGELRPATEAPAQLHRCDVALITGTTIVGSSLDALLEAAAGCREVVLLGASTPLVPEVFVDTPVTLLSGVLVDQPDQVLRVVAEAGGMRRFKPHLSKVNLRLR
jgi:uncharacterized protein (DUF4213/DUF364 family)